MVLGMGKGIHADLHMVYNHYDSLAATAAPLAGTTDAAAAGGGGRDDGPFIVLI